MVVSKSPSTAAAATINLAHFSHAGVAQVWQLTAANSITRLADVGITGASFTYTLPAQSVTLFVLARDGAAPGAPTGLRIKVG
jgi:O-glycosyl hydrolase